jgi:hypothetical protein
MKRRFDLFAVLEVTAKSYWNNTQIWSEEIYPVRVPVRRAIEPRQGVPLLTVAPKLSVFTPEMLANGKRWGNKLHASIKPWPSKDGWTVVDALI